jgi:hypothetical protein
MDAPIFLPLSSTAAAVVVVLFAIAASLALFAVVVSLGPMDVTPIVDVL